MVFVLKEKPPFMKPSEMPSKIKNHSSSFNLRNNANEFYQGKRANPFDKVDVLPGNYEGTGRVALPEKERHAPNKNIAQERQREYWEDYYLFGYGIIADQDW